MQSFTTQSHQRNYQGNVVVPNSASAHAQRGQKRHKILTGVALSAMALAVVVTGGLLGATTIHNRQLKSQLHTLQTEDPQVIAQAENQTETENQTEFEKSIVYLPRTLEIYPDQEINQDQNNEQQERADIRAEERIPALYDGAPRDHHHERGHRRAPISDKQHEAQPLPSINPRHNTGARN